MLNLLNPPEMDVVSLKEVKAHLRLDSLEEDDYLKALISAATGHTEQYLGRSLIARTWQLRWDKRKAGEETSQIHILFPPLLEIISLNVLAGNSGRKKIPIKNYSVDERLTLPILTCHVKAETIEVIYKAGYGYSPESVPASIKHAILLTIADFYENRTVTTIQNQTSFQSLLAPYRIVRLS